MVALCLAETLGGLMLGGPVDGLQVLHGGPVGGEKMDMAGSSNGAVVHLDLLKGSIEKVEAESRP